ncbi:MAG: HAMP domain-containing histidine kinase [Gemmatimonadetes bacterium]|nr:HAMP domain-containing histidine kinase [Gemmatimonadota bacterium]
MARRIAHEMKNPLTPLRLAAYRLEGSAGAANGAISEVVSVIREETDRLDELARSFALIGRPVTGPATQVDLDELMRGLLRTDVPHTIDTSIVAAGTPLIRGHYDALVRAFRNIVKNAVEAIGTGGRSGQLEVRIATRDNGVTVSIADDGTGIPDGMENVLFEPDRTTRAGGTGLGLAIVQQVIASHGGSVAARNRPGGGAEFVVWLPFDHAGTEADPATVRGADREIA